jgi:hypothetical protein
MGDRMTRLYLTTAAVAHIRYANSSLMTWGAGLAKRIGKRRAQVAVARKLAVMMVAMWKSSEPYDAKRGLRAQRDLRVGGEVPIAA